MGFEEGVGSCPSPIPRRQEESAIDGHSEKLLGVERWAESLFTHARALETDLPQEEFGLGGTSLSGSQFLHQQGIAGEERG